MKTFVFLALAHMACGVRKTDRESRKQKRSRGDSFPDIACPVMAALVNRGIMTLDSEGRATQHATMVGLMGTGNSAPMAQFQALGIAAFNGSDKHQVKRVRDGSLGMSELHLNYNVWNAKDECAGSNIPNLPNGRPCNANIGFQQHGFSTTLRDASNGRSARARWNDWMERRGVLVYDPSIKLFGKVMKIDGLAKLLKYAREEGNKDGEFALNADNSFRGSPLSFYHPSTGGDPNEYLPCSQWQAVGAWAAFWAAFGRYSGQTSFMPKDDLERFFFDGDFPADWIAKPWGFKESFKVVREMQGMGAGEEWVAQIANILNTFGEEADELQYMQGLLGALTVVGSRKDDINKPFQR